jgi:glutamate:Na+ symporter, ESS family
MVIRRKTPLLRDIFMPAPLLSGFIGLLLGPQVLGAAVRALVNDWFQRGSGDFGQSIGMAALGLLLIRLADPHDRSRAAERFGYKQVLLSRWSAAGCSRPPW